MALVFVYACVRVLAAGRLKIVSPPRASLSLQHVGTMARCQDTSPSSVLTRRHEEQRLIIYKQTPVHHVWLGTSPALNVTIYEAIRFIAYSIEALWKNLLLALVLIHRGLVPCCTFTAAFFF